MRSYILVIKDDLIEDGVLVSEGVVIRQQFWGGEVQSWGRLLFVVVIWLQFLNDDCIQDMFIMIFDLMFNFVGYLFFMFGFWSIRKQLMINQLSIIQIKYVENLYLDFICICLLIVEFFILFQVLCISIGIFDVCSWI